MHASLSHTTAMPMPGVPKLRAVDVRIQAMQNELARPAEEGNEATPAARDAHDRAYHDLHDSTFSSKKPILGELRDAFRKRFGVSESTRTGAGGGGGGRR